MNCKTITTIIFLILLVSFILPYTLAKQPINLEIDLPNTYKNTLRGNEIWFTVNLLNLGNTTRKDVTLSYALINLDEEIVSSNSKTVAIETQASFVGSLHIPETAELGEYIVQVSISSPEGVSQSRTSVFVKEELETDPLDYLVYVLGGLLIIGIIIFVSKPIYIRLKMKSRIHNMIKFKKNK